MTALLSMEALRRHKVVNDRGENLGHVEDFLFDPEEGGVRFIILASGGGEKLFAFPTTSSKSTPGRSASSCVSTPRTSSRRQVLRARNGQISRPPTARTSRVFTPPGGDEISLCALRLACPLVSCASRFWFSRLCARLFACGESRRCRRGDLRSSRIEGRR